MEEEQEQEMGLGEVQMLPVERERTLPYVQTIASD
jgi:hypothetical protein